MQHVLDLGRHAVGHLVGLDIATEQNHTTLGQHVQIRRWQRESLGEDLGRDEGAVGTADRLDGGLALVGYGVAPVDELGPVARGMDEDVGRDHAAVDESLVVSPTEHDESPLEHPGKVSVVDAVRIGQVDLGQRVEAEAAQERQHVGSSTPEREAVNERLGQVEVELALSMPAQVPQCLGLRLDEVVVGLQAGDLDDSRGLVPLLRFFAFQRRPVGSQDVPAGSMGIRVVILLDGFWDDWGRRRAIVGAAVNVREVTLRELRLNRQRPVGVQMNDGAGCGVEVEVGHACPPRWVRGT